jgi:hypothetical protein
MFNQVSFFEWLAFFFGGAFGSLIILGIQKAWDAISSRRKYKDERAQVTNALIEEIKVNVALCVEIINNINNFPDLVFTFSRFNYSWLETYIARFLDFRITEHREAYEKLDKAKKRMMMIHDLREQQHMFSARIGASTKNRMPSRKLCKDATGRKNLLSDT